jgi:hypothetical protein
MVFVVCGGGGEFADIVGVRSAFVVCLGEEERRVFGRKRKEG